MCRFLDVEEGERARMQSEETTLYYVCLLNFLFEKYYRHLSSFYAESKFLYDKRVTRGNSSDAMKVNPIRIFGKHCNV